MTLDKSVDAPRRSLVSLNLGQVRFLLGLMQRYRKAETGMPRWTTLEARLLAAQKDLEDDVSDRSVSG